ncbi:MAG: hypothetical protein LBI29_02095 [Rickettsiales bacterium]|nr:hypothetical protein [Rickettsiales bacterium]
MQRSNKLLTFTGEDVSVGVPYGSAAGAYISKNGAVVGTTFRNIFLGKAKEEGSDTEIGSGESAYKPMKGI